MPRKAQKLTLDLNINKVSAGLNLDIISPTFCSMDLVAATLDIGFFPLWLEEFMLV